MLRPILSLSGLLICLLTVSNVYSQDVTLDDYTKKLIDIYNQQVKQFSNISGCGHSFDGPASFAKQLERSSLDALIYLSDEEEIEIGKKVFESISESESINNSHWSYKKLNEVFSSLKPHAGRNEIPYTINIIESKDVNAFSTLGGYIYICTGLIEFVESWDEMAFILGHEIAHIDLFHTVRKQKKLLLAKSLGEYLEMDDLANIALNLNLTLSAPFDQIDEYDADYKGYSLAKKAGYNTNKFTDFFTRLERTENKNIINKFLSTHPFPSDRKSCLNSIDSE